MTKPKIERERSTPATSTNFVGRTFSFPKIADCQLYQHIAGFETRKKCAERQQQTVDRLEIYDPTNEFVASLRRCNFQSCWCDRNPACHYVSRRDRIRLIEVGSNLFSEIPSVHCTIVHPAWESGIGQLGQFPVGQVGDWIEDRLRPLGGDVIAMGSFEASVNIEKATRKFWAGEAQLVVAGASADQLKHAFRVDGEARSRRPGQRCVLVQSIATLPTVLSYALKRFVVERRPYESGGRQTIRNMPPRPRQFAEWDGFLSRLPRFGRLLTIGCGLDSSGTALVVRT